MLAFDFDRLPEMPQRDVTGLAGGRLCNLKRMIEIQPVIPTWFWRVIHLGTVADFFDGRIGFEGGFDRDWNVVIRQAFDFCEQR